MKPLSAAGTLVSKPLAHLMATDVASGARHRAPGRRLGAGRTTNDQPPVSWPHDEPLCRMAVDAMLTDSVLQFQSKERNSVRPIRLVRTRVSPRSSGRPPSLLRGGHRGI